MTLKLNHIVFLLGFSDGRAKEGSGWGADGIGGGEYKRMPLKEDGKERAGLEGTGFKGAL